MKADCKLYPVLLGGSRGCWSRRLGFAADASTTHQAQGWVSLRGNGWGFDTRPCRSAYLAAGENMDWPSNSGSLPLYGLYEPGLRTGIFDWAAAVAAAAAGAGAVTESPCFFLLGVVLRWKACTAVGGRADFLGTKGDFFSTATDTSRRGASAALAAPASGTAASLALEALLGAPRTGVRRFAESGVLRWWSTIDF